MRLQNVHPFCLPSADYLMGELYALSPFKPIFNAKSVQGGGGFWVAVREILFIVGFAPFQGFIFNTARSIFNRDEILVALISLGRGVFSHGG
jgi:hypothetical protein